ncbi:MAG: PAS domain S-box protein [Desulfomonile tiedjei]|nr:PAS domain S-box protein [Desulfomonile tiedjei]
MSADIQATLLNVQPGTGDEDPIERIILRSMNEGVITLECNGNIFMVNPAALRILDLAEEEVRGSNYEHVFSLYPENEEFKEIFREALKESTRIERKETRFRRRDGQFVDLTVTSSFLETDACVPSLETVVVVFRDITAFKSLERAKRRAVNHISHELKTPLAIIGASVQRLVDRELPREDALRSLQRAQRNIRRLSEIQSIVEEILNPPPYSAGRKDVPRLVGAILDDIRQKASGRTVSLLSRIEVEETDLLDPNILRMVLVTLVKNAIENTPDQGQVIVSLKESDSGILLQVQDFGVGISLRNQEFIFEGFLYTQPTDEYSTKKPFEFNAGGKGLELLRLKVLAESGYFDIWFDSTRCRHVPTDEDLCPGAISDCPHRAGLEECSEAGGTTFSVLFPKHSRARAEESRLA